MIGVYNDNGTGAGAKMGIVSWVYILVPFAGSALAALFYLLHSYIDNNRKTKQTEPM
jgi:hypothetical protein